VALTPDNKKALRAAIASFCTEAERYESRWTYSQRRPFTGLGAAPQTWHTDDCSAYCALAFYFAMRESRVIVSDPLGYRFSGYGNTGSAINYLDAHRAPQDKYRVGDMAIYGQSRWATRHMTICRKAGSGDSSVWSSHGSQSGPDNRTLHYRSDLIGVYRHPALL